MRKILLVLVALSPFVAQAQPGKVQANGITIAYESFGKPDKQAILLINGTGSPLTDWPEAFCKDLAGRGYRVIRFDNRDAGLTTHLDSLGQPDWAGIIPLIKKCGPAPLPYTLLDMAKDATGLLTALKIDKAHIVGVSMGGAIAQILTINFPDRVRSLTSVMASSGNPELPPAKPEAMAAMMTPPPASTHADTLSNYMAGIYKALGSTDGEALRKQRALMHINRAWYPTGTARHAAAVIIGDNCDRRPDLAKIKVPAMVIHGDADPLVTVASGKEVAATIPGCELVVVEGMGHDVSERFLGQMADAVVRNVGRAKK
ncbi:alpha/beta fold hydrolase [Chitinophaga horti]|uniref:Alpha/beta fold hydrolase n=1 Tax=Chitinophaga horti TaxID=2920382 RepID=A0ABY6IUX5_9BACT|nr:alpha/beta hydrolase [Chitinophaga horti]UYQ91175.1 alpha/beta fold hydrolase [Chitinophaga horti]